MKQHSKDTKPTFLFLIKTGKLSTELKRKKSKRNFTSLNEKSYSSKFHRGKGGLNKPSTKRDAREE